MYVMADFFFFLLIQVIMELFHCVPVVRIWVSSRYTIMLGWFWNQIFWKLMGIWQMWPMHLWPRNYHLHTGRLHSRFLFVHLFIKSSLKVYKCNVKYVLKIIQFENLDFFIFFIFIFLSIYLFTNVWCPAWSFQTRQLVWLL